MSVNNGEVNFWMPETMITNEWCKLRILNKIVIVIILNTMRFEFIELLSDNIF